MKKGQQEQFGTPAYLSPFQKLLIRVGADPITGVVSGTGENRTVTVKQGAGGLEMVVEYHHNTEDDIISLLNEMKGQ